MIVSQMRVFRHLEDSADAALRCVEQREFVRQVAEAADVVTDCLRDGGKVLSLGCGGSAADAQHFCAELVGRFRPPARSGLPAVALTADGVLLTAVANDWEFAHVFARQIDALAREGDVVIALSTTFQSEAVQRAVAHAVSAGLQTVLITGEILPELCDKREMGALFSPDNIRCLRTDLLHVVRCPSTTTAIVQQLTISALHAIASHVDQECRT